jgi:hypothetical protein
LTQVDYVLNKAAARNCIIRKQYPFKGRNVLHIRFTPECFQALLDESVKFGIPAKRRSAKVPNCGRQKCQTLSINSEYKLENELETAIGCAELRPHTGDISTEETPDASDNVIAFPKVEAMTGAKKIEQQVLANATRPLDMAKLKPNSAHHLAKIWREACLKRDFPVAVDFTQKEMGQLKQIARKAPEGKAFEFIQRLIDQWEDFIIEAETNHGGFKPPHQPNIRYALKFISAGYNLPEPIVMKKIELHSNAHVKPAPKPQPQPEPPPQRKLTWEELNAEADKIRQMKKGAA